MKVFEEITKWHEATPNHTYFMDDSKSKAYAYIPVGGTELFEFKIPLKLDTRGRKFREVPNTMGFFPRDDLKAVSKCWQVKGSKGDEYTITEEHGVLSCSCSGFKFRAKCKHTEQSNADQTK